MWSYLGNAEQQEVYAESNASVGGIVGGVVGAVVGLVLVVVAFIMYRRKKSSSNKAST